MLEPRPYGKPCGLAHTNGDTTVESIALRGILETHQPSCRRAACAPTTEKHPCQSVVGYLVRQQRLRHRLNPPGNQQKENTGVPMEV